MGKGAELPKGGDIQPGPGWPDWEQGKVFQLEGTA